MSCPRACPDASLWCTILWQNIFIRVVSYGVPSGIFNELSQFTRSNASWRQNWELKWVSRVPASKRLPLYWQLICLRPILFLLSKVQENDILQTFKSSLLRIGFVIFLIRLSNLVINKWIVLIRLFFSSFLINNVFFRRCHWWKFKFWRQKAGRAGAVGHNVCSRGYSQTQTLSIILRYRLVERVRVGANFLRQQASQCERTYERTNERIDSTVPLAAAAAAAGSHTHTLAGWLAGCRGNSQPR